jgi:hypothetical protein
VPSDALEEPQTRFQERVLRCLPTLPGILRAAPRASADPNLRRSAFARHTPRLHRFCNSCCQYLGVIPTTAICARIVARYESGLRGAGAALTPPPLLSPRRRELSLSSLSAQRRYIPGRGQLWARFIQSQRSSPSVSTLFSKLPVSRRAGVRRLRCDAWLAGFLSTLLAPHHRWVLVASGHPSTARGVALAAIRARVPHLRARIAAPQSAPGYVGRLARCPAGQPMPWNARDAREQVESR